MNHRRSFVVAVAAIDLSIGNGRQRPKPFIIDVGLLQHKQLVVLDHFHKFLPAAQHLLEEVAGVFRKPLLDPHVVVQPRRQHVSPPVVSQLMAVQSLVLEIGILEHGYRIGDVGGVLHGSFSSDHIPNALPSMRTPPVFQSIDANRQVYKSVAHGLKVGWLGGEANRNVAVDAGVNRIEILVLSDGNRTQISGDGLRHVEDAPNGVPAQAVGLNPVSLAVKPLSSRTGNGIGICGPLFELIKTRIPSLAVVWGNAGEANAQTVDVIPCEVHPAPIRVRARLTVVMNGQCLRANAGPSSFRGLNKNGVSHLIKPPNAALQLNRINLHGPHEVKPEVLRPRLGGFKIDGGQSRDLKRRCSGHIQLQSVMNHIKRVAPGKGASHVEVFGRGRPTSRLGCQWHMHMAATMVRQISGHRSAKWWDFGFRLRQKAG